MAKEPPAHLPASPALSSFALTNVLREGNRKTAYLPGSPLPGVQQTISKGIDHEENTASSLLFSRPGSALPLYSTGVCCTVGNGARKSNIPLNIYKVLITIEKADSDSLP